ncbi:DUF1559 domain-containing protein [uncultured Gimesia sp.]|uniref:DUF1559 domain-containing protein n=1 Tax=uncultured Gimesia sp. TaxID=1678688 RepID=UPI00261750F7|nr:DUF1559 domain-containing protein [uncultured Gimesia sp.]
MTTETSSPDQPETNSKALTLTVVVILCVFTFCQGVIFPFILAFQLIAGWFFYLKRELPTLTISLEQTFWFLSALIVFSGGVHIVCCKYHSRTDTTQGSWQKYWTLSLVAMLLMLVMSGICIVSITHQTWWMATDESDTFLEEKPHLPFFVSSCREAARRSTSKNNLKQIGLAMHNYHDLHSRLPIGGTFRAGQPHHSWVTRLLPFVEQESLYNKIDFHEPWTDKTNKEHFQSRINAIQNPGLKSDYDNGKSSEETFQGYQPAHYAANSRVLNVNGGMNFKEITDGTSNTILAGEIRSNIKPWGNPTNFRDPARGINQSRHGFGGPFKGGANILLGDGSVRFISEDIDPAVLKALSTPNSGEPVDEF